MRYRLRRGGRLLFVDRPCLVACTIRDLSADGALLSVLEPTVLPPVVLLWEETGSIHECTVRWRRETLVGVHFTDIRGRAMRHAALEKGFADLPVTAAGTILLH